MNSFFSLLLILALAACSGTNGTGDVKIVHFPGTDLVEQSITYANGKKNGPAKEFYRNGNLKTRQFFVNDSLNDTSATYYENGRLQSLHVYKNKIKNGCWKEFNKEGKVYSEIFMKDGLLDSTSSIYTYRTLKLQTRVTYKNGMKNGREELYYTNGKPKSVVYYSMGYLCKGTEEWEENGRPINNDFKISITERNEVLMKGVLSYLIRLENPQPGDKVFQVTEASATQPKVETIYPLKRVDNYFLLEFNVGKGSFVMEKVTLAAYRETAFGNTYIKTTSFNVSANNF